MLNSLAHSLRSRYRQSVEKRTSLLDSQTRTDLAREIHSSTLAELGELQEVNIALEQTHRAFTQIEEKKHFVGMRLAGYQEKLDEQARKLERAEERLAGAATVCPLLQDDDEGMDDEHLSVDEVERQREQLRKDQEALERVRTSHEAMKVNALALQKKIFVLERKREEVLQKTEECRDFLVAAAEVEQDRETEHDDTVDSGNDLEAGR